MTADLACGGRKSGSRGFQEAEKLVDIAAVKLFAPDAYTTWLGATVGGGVLECPPRAAFTGPRIRQRTTSDVNKKDWFHRSARPFDRGIVCLPLMTDPEFVRLRCSPEVVHHGFVLPTRI